jgi:hypothetical protein
MKSGYIYIIQNEIYEHYGKNIYKIGKTKDIDKVKEELKTAYIKPTEIIYVSEYSFDYETVEAIIFLKMNDKRLSEESNFFKVENIEEMKKMITEVINDRNKKYNESHLIKCEICGKCYLKGKKRNHLKDYDHLIAELEK